MKAHRFRVELQCFWCNALLNGTHALVNWYNLLITWGKSSVRMTFYAFSNSLCFALNIEMVCAVVWFAKVIRNPRDNWKHLYNKTLANLSMTNERTHILKKLPKILHKQVQIMTWIVDVQDPRKIWVNLDFSRLNIWSTIARYSAVFRWLVCHQ